MPDSNEKPPVRPVFRKLAWVVAAVFFCMALVAVTGFMGAEHRLWMTLLSLFIGFVFTTIGLPVSPGAATFNFIMGTLCLLVLLAGVDKLDAPSFLVRFLGGLMVICGGVGVLANLGAYLQRRKQAKKKENGK